MAKKKRRVKDCPVFVRPVAAAEVFNEENKRKFDEMAGWEREFIARALNVQNVSKAVAEAGLHNKKALTVQQKALLTPVDALEAVGVDAEFIANKFKDILTTWTLKMDKHGNAIKMEDHPTRLKALETILKLRGDIIHNRVQSPGNPKKKPNNLIDMVKEMDDIDDAD